MNQFWWRSGWVMVVAIALVGAGPAVGRSPPVQPQPLVQPTTGDRLPGSHQPTPSLGDRLQPLLVWRNVMRHSPTFIAFGAVLALLSYLLKHPPDR
jgi:hypothetical protein